MLYLVFLALALYVLFLFVRGKVLSARMRAKGFHVVEVNFPPSLLTTICDIIIPKNVRDKYPFFPTNKIAEDALVRAYDETRCDFLALVGYFDFTPPNVIVVCFNEKYAREASDMIGVVDKDISKYGVLNYFGLNIVTTNGSEWKRHRKISTAAFTQKNLKLVRQVSMYQAKELLKVWDKQRGSAKSLEVFFGGEDILMQLTLGVFGESIFGAKMDVFEDADEKSFCKNLTFTNSNLHLALTMPKALGSVLPHIKRVHEGMELLQHDMAKFLKHARENEEGKQKTDLLSLLSRANQRQNPLTEQEAIADVWMFCLAGMETSAHTMGWTFMRLAFHQDVQQRLYEESKKFGDDLMALVQDTAPYNYAVLYETLRMHPAVTTLPLMVREDTVVGGDLKLEKGWGFNIHVGVAGRHEKSFQDPLEFKPERFLQEDGKFSTATASILSFNVGPRGCIGKQVALMEMSITIAAILSEYRVVPVKSFEECSEWTSRVTREFATPMPFKFEKRE